MGMKVSLVETDCGFANYCRETGALAHGFGIFGL
jgi:hypothetical protein